MGIFHWISADARRRFAISLAAGLVGYLTIRHHLSIPARGIVIWDTFAFFATSLAWLAISITPQDCLRGHARLQDTSRLVIFIFVVTATCIALFAVAVLIRTHHEEMRTGFNW